MFYASKLIEILKVEHCSFVFAESHCHNKLLWVFFNNSMAKIIFMFSLYQIYISKWSMHNAGTCSNHTSTPLTQTASSTMEKAGLDIGLATVTCTRCMYGPVIWLLSPYQSWYSSGGTVSDVWIVDDCPQLFVRWLYMVHIQMYQYQYK